MIKKGKQVPQTRSQKIKSKARKSLSKTFVTQKKTYVVDTSTIINKFLPNLISKGLQGKIIIPNSIIAELEHLANKGREEGFTGLEEVAKLHKLKNKISLSFEGERPTDSQIRHAKSGAIDALIRNIAVKRKAILITADLVQAKSAQAYGLEVLFLRPKLQPPEKKSFLHKIFGKRKN